MDHAANAPRVYRPLANWLLWGPLLAGGILVAAIDNRRGRRGLRGLLLDAANWWFYGTTDPRRVALRQHQQSLDLLRHAIAGNTKYAVAAAFGPPHAALHARESGAERSAGPAFLRSDTWYYPLGGGHRLAMAIRFQEGRARDVEFVKSV